MKIKKIHSTFKTLMTTQLNAQWIVGFVDGEGCFNLDVHEKEDMRWKLQMQPEFTVVQNEVDIQLLHAFKDFFQCGSVGVNRRDKHGTRYHYRVKSVKDLTEKIIPFFDKHSLKTKKKIEYIRFRRICLLMKEGYHRESLKTFLEIYDLGQSLRVRSREKKMTKRGLKIVEIVHNLRAQVSSQT
jgi:hypothetical protein